MNWEDEQKLFGGRRIDVIEPHGILIRADELLVDARHERDALELLQRSNRRRNRRRDIDRADELEIESEEVGRETSEMVSIRITNAPRDSGDMIVEVVSRLVDAGVPAQPNHIFTVHSDGCSCGCGCGPHPSGVTTSPFQTHPFQTHPFQTHPFQTHPFQTHLPPQSSARPATEPQTWATKKSGPARAEVLVLDTGLPDRTAPAGPGSERLPATLKGSRFSGDFVDVPDGELIDASGATHPADGRLDPVAGHGAFIAGIIDQVVPGAKVVVKKVASRMGFVDENLVADAIEAMAFGANKPQILSMSFGGPTMVHPKRISAAVRAATDTGVVVVASAGNDATCIPHYPAALPEVIGVGALGPSGPAPFTNFGPWVDACAPGVDLVSTFFTNFKGKQTASAAFGALDPDDFMGWARWSGTSFATPYVVGAIVREMAVAKTTPTEAAFRVVFAPHLPRLTTLGTIVR